MFEGSGSALSILPFQRSSSNNFPLCSSLYEVIMMVTMTIPMTMTMTRFVSLRPHVFTLSPTDMKLLNHEHRVSVVWLTFLHYCVFSSVSSNHECCSHLVNFCEISGEHDVVPGSDSKVSNFTSHLMIANCALYQLCSGAFFLSTMIKKNINKFHFRMNSTFRAYLLPERPKLRHQKHRVSWYGLLWKKFFHRADSIVQDSVELERNILAKNCSLWYRYDMDIKRNMMKIMITRWMWCGAGANGEEDCWTWRRYEGVLGLLPPQRLPLQVNLDGDGDGDGDGDAQGFCLFSTRGSVCCSDQAQQECSKVISSWW